MSRENVEVVRRFLDAFNARDVDVLLSLAAEDFEWRPFRAQLEGTIYRGHDGIRQFLSDLEEDWESYRIDALEFRDRGDRVAMIGQVNARGRGSNMEIAAVAGFVHELERERIKRMTSHSDVEAALEAAGLRE